MASNGRKEKFDKRITLRIDNLHNIKLTEAMHDSKAVWADIVRACMVKLESDVSPDDASIIRSTIAKLHEEGLVSGEEIRRDILVSETFRLHFGMLALNIGYDLSDYIVTAVQLYLPSFAKNPSFAIHVYTKWEKGKRSAHLSQNNDSPKQMSLSMCPKPENGHSA